MYYKQRFYFNLSLLLLAYAYAFQAQTTPAIVFGVTSCLLSIYNHSVFILARKGKRIFFDVFASCVIIRLFHLETIVPELFVLVICSEIFGLMWMESSYKVIHEIMEQVEIFFVILVTITIGMPDAWIAYVAHGTDVHFMQVLCMLVLLFGPLAHYYYLKVNSYSKKHDYKARSWYHNRKDLTVRGL